MDIKEGNEEKIPCTVAVLTKNNEATLKRALESAKDFAEIIIVDGGSTDRTLDIARAYGAKIIPQDPTFKDEKGRIKDFAGVHNQALRASQYDWHFYLDSDEVLTPALIAEISSLIRANGGIKNEAAVWVDRKYVLEDVQGSFRSKAAARIEPSNSSAYYEGEPQPPTQQMKTLGHPLGKVIECAATYPTRQMRFFHKGAVTEFIKPIHERINPKPDAVIKKTQNFMLVPVSADPRVWREKWKHYIELEVARRLPAQAGAKISFGQWLGVCFENLKVSTLYTFRFVYQRLFCRGTKMPLALEWERHVYLWNICKALWKYIR